MNRADLIKVLMETELADRRNLSRVRARAIVNEVFNNIKEALQNGEVVRLPIGALAVTEQRREPTRSWFLGRVRVTYKERNQIVFGGGGDDFEETDGDAEPHKQRARRPKLSPSERRKLAIIGVKAGKSRISIAKELRVSETTIRRDLKSPVKPAKKKSGATRRKPGAPPKEGSHKGASRKPSVSKAIGTAKSTLRKILDSERPTAAEEARQQRLQEMVDLVDSWLAEQKRDYRRATSVVDIARNKLSASSHAYFRGIPEPSMSAEALRDQTRPPEVDSARAQNLSRREEVCAQWLSRWIAEWEPRDEALRNEVFRRVRAIQRVYPVFA
jgi:nucleoid DNA-binding protein